MRVALALTLILAVGIASGARHGHAQETGWRIDRFAAEITVQPDGVLQIVERIDVTFDEARRGIIREIPVRYDYDDEHVRLYELNVLSVTDAGLHPHPFTETIEGANHRTRIGDPDVFLTGPQSYWITYEVDGAINSFPEHYELYWNVTGVWGVPIEQSSAIISVTGGGITQGQCYAGALGSSEPCGGAIVGTDMAGFDTGRGLLSNEQLTVVTALGPEALSEPRLILEEKDPNPILDFLGLSPLTIAASVAILAAGAGFLAVNWWREGRDRTYTTLYYLSKDTTERTRRPFARREIVVEYTPPDDMRPAQMGLILDERADDLDVTATIVDLAARGYLTIHEEAEPGLFSPGDWRVEKQAREDNMKPYERSLYTGLMGDNDRVWLSNVRYDYITWLKRAQDQLYDEAVERSWFPAHPDEVRSQWRSNAVKVLSVGVVTTIGLGAAFGLGVLGLPIIALAAPIFLFAGAMPRRTAKGSEQLRRVLGFRLFIETAEARRAEFAEKENLFSEYLPYAIVFGCVDKWAKVFRDAQLERSVQHWYTGEHLTSFTSGAIASHLHSFAGATANAVNLATVNTAGGSGMSGLGSFGGAFGGAGGFAGGGGGGGGGTSW